MIPFQIVLGRGCTAETIRECIPALFRALEEQGVDLAALMRQQPVQQPPTEPRSSSAALPSAIKGPWELAYNAPEGFGASLRLTADQDAALVGLPPAMIAKIRESIAEFCIKGGRRNGQLRPMVTIVGDEYEITSGTAERAEAQLPAAGDGDAAAGAADW